MDIGVNKMEISREEKIETITKIIYEDKSNMWNSIHWIDEAEALLLAEKILDKIEE